MRLKSTDESGIPNSAAINRYKSLIFSKPEMRPMGLPCANWQLKTILRCDGNVSLLCVVDVNDRRIPLVGLSVAGVAVAAEISDRLDSSASRDLSFFFDVDFFLPKIGMTYENAEKKRIESSDNVF